MVEAGRSTSNDDLILRFDPETKEIVGFTIIDFLAHFSQPEPRLCIPLDASFQPLVDVENWSRHRDAAVQP